LVGEHTNIAKEQPMSHALFGQDQKRLLTLLKIFLPVSLKVILL
jgi:hypothetical protein